MFLLHEESSKFENAAIDLSVVPKTLVTIRAARDKTKGKSEGKSKSDSLTLWKGHRKVAKTQLSQNIAKDKLAARKSKSTCHERGQRGHWAGDPQCPGTRDAHFTTWPDDQMCSQIVMTAEPSRWLSGLNNLVFFIPVQVCVSIESAQILSRIFDVLLSMRTSQFLLLSLAPFLLHSQLTPKKFVVL